jgi:hypothetical protein
MCPVWSTNETWSRETFILEDHIKIKQPSEKLSQHISLL